MKHVIKLILALVLPVSAASGPTSHQITICGTWSHPACAAQLVPSPDGTTLSLIMPASVPVGVSTNHTGLVTITTGTASSVTPPLISGDFFTGGTFDVGGSFDVAVPDFSIDYSGTYANTPLSTGGGNTIPGGAWIASALPRAGGVVLYHYTLRTYLADGSAFSVVTKTTTTPFDGTTPLDVAMISINVFQ